MGLRILIAQDYLWETRLENCTRMILVLGMPGYFLGWSKSISECLYKFRNCLFKSNSGFYAISSPRESLGLLHLVDQQVIVVNTTQFPNLSAWHCFNIKTHSLTLPLFLSSLGKGVKLKTIGSVRESDCVKSGLRLQSWKIRIAHWRTERIFFYFILS